MNVCVRVCACARKTFKRKESTRRRETKRRENKYSLIQMKRQTDGQTDRHKSFIDMRYNTEQYSKSNSIKENRIKSNRINLKKSRIE